MKKKKMKQRVRVLTEQLGQKQAEIDRLSQLLSVFKLGFRAAMELLAETPEGKNE